MSDAQNALDRARQWESAQLRREVADQAGDGLDSDAPLWASPDDRFIRHVVPGMTASLRRDREPMVALCGHGPIRDWTPGWAYEEVSSRGYGPVCPACTGLLPEDAR